MASIAEMRSALCSTVHAAIPELLAYTNARDAIQVPCIIVGPPTANFAVEVQRGFKTSVMSMGLDGLQEWDFDLYVLVGVQDLPSAQEQLDQYVQGVGDKSIRQAIFNDNTLGGVVEDCMVMTMSGYGGTYPIAGITHIGATLKLKVLTSG
jgi:hypothetical protein